MARPGPDDICTDFQVWGEWLDLEDDEGAFQVFRLFAITPGAYVEYAMSPTSARKLIHPEYAQAHLRMLGYKLWDYENGYDGTSS